MTTYSLLRLLRLALAGYAGSGRPRIAVESPDFFDLEDPGVIPDEED